MSAQTLPATADQAGAPEWIHLLPAGVAGRIETDDDRGPYLIADAQKIIDASFAGEAKLAIDENHATDLAAPRGDPAPARGWIVGMQARPDGIWGRVEWTAHGAELVASRAYRGISPVILAGKDDKVIHSILRASLVNRPNLRGMASLHQKETGMNFRDKLIEMLGLAATATDDEVMAALSKKMKGGADAPAMQSAFSDVAVALGLGKDAKPADLVAAAQAARASKSDAGRDGLITELQSSVLSLATELNAMKAGQSAAASEAFYNQALAERRAGVGPRSKAHLISMHQSDPAAAEAFVADMPQLNSTATSLEPPAPKGGEVHLNAAQKAVARQLGRTEAEYAAELKLQAEEEAL